MSYPAGVHVGVRMDTGGDPTGPAGSYQGTLTMRYVPYEQWNSVFFAKYLDVNKGKLVSFVKRGEERTETRQSSSVLVAQLGCGPCLLRF